MNEKNKDLTIVVGMSGGVDSSVAALKLKEEGYNVIGLFMKNWEEKDSDGVCTSQADYEDVKRVCSKIGIPYFTVNFTQEYYDKVFSQFLVEYEKGRTPNPDVLCNREIKFGPFLEKALSLGANKVATGHYAIVEEINGKYYLKKSLDKNKDQTYFLCQLNQTQLSKALFPIGKMQKPELREIAKLHNFSTAEKKDSTGICFIGERNFRNFLKGFIPARAGDILDMSGKKVGEHIGSMYYTIGQRRGLNIGGTKNSNGDRWFVIKKDVKNNIIYVNQGECDELYSNVVGVSEMNWIPSIPKETEFDCYAKFRYRQPDQKVKVTIISDDKIIISAYEKQRAVTPGQFAVLYDENENCLGGGVIDYAN